MREVMIQFLQRGLLRWFDENGRDFPWRDPTTTKYKQILSEILLQRTRAETVARYYACFFDKYPDWKSLSRATIDELEEIMRPLGLYRHRARRLYKLGQEIKRRRGRIPETSDELADSGFGGLYVINAFELFALHKRKPLLDVNMSRVLKRYFNAGEFMDVRHDKVVQALANDIIEVRRCKELNWAILDFAALVCTKRAPACGTCTLSPRCLYRQRGETRGDSC
jgi:A/G-specific adenine glycosylase